LAEKGVTREDLLAKLDEVIRNGEASVNGVASDSSSDKISEVSSESEASSIFEGDIAKDSNSSFTSDDESTVKKAGDKVAEGEIEKLRTKAVEEITAFLQKEPAVSESELKSGNQN